VAPRKPAALLVVLVVASVATAAAAAAPPRLGQKWGPYQKGYGKAHPRRIYNGGDPTGDVRHIHWRHWGRRKAVGRGRSVYVWPGSAVADNPFTSGARVVAFHLGMCHGRRSYNAIEWFFPKYGESFDPRTYINTCTGKYVGGDPAPRWCVPARLAGRKRRARQIEAYHVRCSRVRKLIARSSSAQYVRHGGRFRIGSYRCGTGGSGGEPGGAVFECEKDRRAFLWVQYG
jgi:hypothetical protein